MNEGCSWFTTDCIDTTNYTSNYAQYFCDSAHDDGCNHDYKAPAKCLFTADYETDLSQITDYCPLRSLTGYEYENDYYSVCYDLRGRDIKNGNFGKQFNYGMKYAFFLFCSLVF